MNKSNQNSILFYFLSFLIVIPIFVQISSSGISIIDNYKESYGVPLSVGFFALIILFFRNLNLKLIILSVLIFYYALVSYIDSTYRALNVLQGFIFIVSFYTFNHLNEKEMRTISKNSIFFLKFFICLHAVSIFYYSNYNFLEFRNFSSKFFDIEIYQAYLTYPLVMIFSLFLFEVLKLKKNINFYLFHLFPVIFFVILLERRTALALLLIYMALFNRKLFIYTLCILGPLFLILGFDYNILSNQLFNRVLDFENYLYTRADTWSYSLEIISDYKLLFFGNGINNYSHNLFLHIITTQGIIYFLTIIIMIIFILKKVLTNPEINRNEIFFLFSIILIDWNVNTNIYMPYYAIYIALLLTMMSKSYQLTNKEDIIEKK